ncbi:mechanosensitive ion channel, partial [Psychromarinibacter sp. C21-152]
MTFDPRNWSLSSALDAASPDVVASLLLVLVLWVTRAVIVKLIRLRSDLPPHVLRRWIATTRTAFLILVLLGLVLIWAPQLRTFALSLAAVAVAIVVATKEMILCLSGSLMRASTRAFSVGDWIEVAGVRGEVVDHTLLATTLQEFQPNSFHYTGRTAVVPNSVLFGSPVRNLTVVREYTFHSFAITTEADVNLPGREAEIADIVERQYGLHREEAARA